MILFIVKEMLKELSNIKLIGIVFVIIAIISRAGSYKIWEESIGKGEHLFVLLAAPMIGSILAGIMLINSGFPRIQWLPLLLVFFTAFSGIATYWVTNHVVAFWGAYRTRLFELVQIPVLFLLHLFVNKTWPNILEGLIVISIAFVAVLAAIDRTSFIREEIENQ